MLTIAIPPVIPEGKLSLAITHEASGKYPPVAGEPYFGIPEMWQHYFMMTINGQIRLKTPTAARTEK